MIRRLWLRLRPALIRFGQWLLHGSDDLVLDKRWIADTARLRQYEAYTRRQHQMGAVVKDVAATRRDAFWANLARKRERPANVTSIRERQSR
jgi:hypothetical protein